MGIHDDQKRRVSPVAFLVLGLGLGFALSAVVALVVTFHRVDAQGTSPTSAERWTQWGGLLVGFVLFAVGRAMARPGMPHR
jgi:hypothetical protein